MNTIYSNNGFVSTTWGPAMWMILHMVSMNYPILPSDQERYEYSTWFKLVGSILPCGACRDNFNKSLIILGFDINVDMKSRETFSRFVHLLHTYTNKILQKNIFVRYEDTYAFYEQLRATDCKSVETEDACTKTKKTMCSISFGTERGIFINKECM